MSKHVSYSELSDFRQCPYKWELSWRERWKPSAEAAPLAKGRLFHEVLATYYTALKEGRDPDVAVTAVLEACPDEELREHIGWMYGGYRECYGVDARWQILAVEEVREVWLSTARGFRSGYRLKTKVDLLVADELGRVWLVDHKTAADFPREVSLECDDQFSLYQWALKQCGIEVHGVIYNCCRTRRNKGPMSLEDRFKRIPMYRTQAQLANTAIDAWRTTKRMHSLRPGLAERAADTDRCTWRCPYTEACLYGRKGGRIEDFLESKGFTRVNGHKPAKEQTT